jgi:geranylgeranyl pyrophosphate synthase
MGLPWDRTLLDVAAKGLASAGPVLAAVPDLMAAMEPVTAAVTQLKDAATLVERTPAGRAAEAAIDEALETISRGVSAVPTGLPVVPETDPSAAPTGFLDRLEWYRQRAMEALGEELPVKEPGRYLYDLVRDFVAQPSKGLRPGLCLATCRAYGGSPEAALPSAAGLELLHNAFLVHDDIEDASLSRRGQPTLHRRVGIPVAVNVGDAMNALSMRLFRRNLAVLGPETALRIIEEVDHLLVESLEGQAMELGWIRDNDCGVTTDDYLRLVLKKTAWYSFIHPMRIGALAAGCCPDGLDRFHRFGFLLGAAFQIQDDILNLTGVASRYGKEIGGDLWEGKRTLVLSHAFSHASPSDRVRLDQFFSRSGQPRLAREMQAIYDVLDRSGSIDWARQAAAELARAAQKELALAFAGAREGPDLDFVRSLVDYVVERDV